MAHLEELVQEISFSVDKISSRINEEKEKIKQFKERQAHIMKQNNEIKQNNDQLRADIERLEQTIYRETHQTEQLIKASELVEQRVQSLSKALEEVDRADEKMRNEKSSLLEEYHKRLHNFENSLQRNAILRDFIENWQCHVKRNKDLLVFPSVVKNLAASLENFYSCNLAGQLEGLVSDTEAGGDNFVNPCLTEVEIIAAKQQSSVPSGSEEVSLPSETPETESVPQIC